MRKDESKPTMLISIILAAILILFLFTSCKTKTMYVPVESVRTEYRNQLQRDSILLYDSVFVKEKGDSVILEKYRYIYRDRYRNDTILKSDTISIPYPVVETREIKTYPSWLLVLACLGCVSVGMIVFSIYRKFK